MQIRTGDLIKQSDVTWKSVSVGQKIMGTDVYPNKVQGTLITQSNFTNIVNYGQLNIFGDGSCIQYYPLDGNQNDMGGRYNQSLVLNITFSTSDKIYGSGSQYFNGSSSRIRLMDFNTLYNLVQGNKSWTVSLFFKSTSEPPLPEDINFEYYEQQECISEFGWGGCGSIPDTEQQGHKIYLKKYTSVLYGGAGLSRPTYTQITTYKIKILYWSNHLTQYASSIEYQINYNTWYHLVISYNHTTGKQNIYLNGVKIFSNITWDNYFGTVDREPWNLGCYVYQDGHYEGTCSHYFKGNIDNIRLFNRQLSDSEVLYLTSESNSNITPGVIPEPHNEIRYSGISGEIPKPGI